MKKGVKLYNLIFPIYLIYLFPTLLWLLLIPANYLIDRFVLRWGLPKQMEEKNRFLRRNTWKILVFMSAGR